MHGPCTCIEPHQLSRQLATSSQGLCLLAVIGLDVVVGRTERWWCHDHGLSFHFHDYSQGANTQNPLLRQAESDLSEGLLAKLLMRPEAS